MILALGLLGLVLLALPALASRPATRLPAADWARIVIVALVAGVSTLLGALVLASAPAWASIVGAPAVVDHCRGVLAPLATDPTLLSWAALALAALLVVRLVRGAVRAVVGAHRARVEAWLGDHHEEDGYDLVVLPTSEVVAFGVPGSPPQVVISIGLVDVLDRHQAAAVIAHEVAHHRLGHARALALFAGIERAFTWFGPATHSIDVGRAALEAWADEAAGDASTRRSLRAALCGLARRTGDAEQRVARLLRRTPMPAPLVRFVTYAPVAAILATVLAIVTGWATDGHHAVALGAPCHH